MSLLALDNQYHMWTLIMEMERDFSRYESEIFRNELMLEDDRAELERLELFLADDKG